MSKMVPLTVYVPEDYVPLIETRVKEEGYRSLSALGCALFEYDLLARRPHKLSAKTAHLPPVERDKIIAQIVAEFDRTERKPGGYFQHQVEDEAKRIQGQSQPPAST